MVKIAALGVALALPLLPISQVTPSKAKVHGFSLSGTVASVDASKKTLVVRNQAGAQTRLAWTDATRVLGGKLAAGQIVTLRYLDRDGKHIATTIRIGPPPGAPTPDPNPAPTPSAPPH